MYMILTDPLNMYILRMSTLLLLYFQKLEKFLTFNNQYKFVDWQTGFIPLMIQ